MSQRNVTLGVIVIALITPALAQDATNQDPDVQPPKIARVNLQQVIVDSREGKEAFNTLTQRFEPRKEELKRQKDELDDMKQKLSAADSTLSEKERQKRTREIANKEKDLSAKFEAAKKEFDKATQAIVFRVGVKAEKAIEKYASANGFAMVVDNSAPQASLIYASAAVVRARGLEGKSGAVLEKELLSYYAAVDKIDITSKVVEVVDTL